MGVDEGPGQSWKQLEATRGLQSAGGQPRVSSSFTAKQPAARPIRVLHTKSVSVSDCQDLFDLAHIQPVVILSFQINKLAGRTEPTSVQSTTPNSLIKIVYPETKQRDHRHHSSSNTKTTKAQTLETKRCKRDGALLQWSEWRANQGRHARTAGP
jgi:hypothetical protein